MQTAAGVGALVGRDVEVALLRAFLERRPEDGAAALLVEGEPGIGKTAMCRAATEAACERGFRVLRARPSEAERTLSFAALADLLGDAHGVIEQLPAMQRRPLGVALLLEETDGPTPDRRAIGVALLATLRTLAEERPLLLAIDDTQWIDPPTAAALAFALRRLADQPLCVVMTERTGSDAALGQEVARAVPCERLALGPLSLGAVRRLLQERLDAVFPRPIVRRIYDQSAGNAFFALELARALRSRGGVLSPADELPVPRELESLLAERLERLPSETQEPLAAVAALAEPTLDLVEEELLEPAFADGVLALEHGRIRFAHPLLAAVAYQRLAPRARQVLHRRLGELARDPEQRARHLALGADRTDAAVAATMDEAAAHAQARGAAGTAAELAEHAITLTPPDDEEGAAVRRAKAAEYEMLTGEDRRARALLEQALGDDPAGPARARVLQGLAMIEDNNADVERGIAILREALEHSRGDDALEAELNAQLANMLYYVPREAEPFARSAVEVAERVGDPVLLAAALCSLGKIEFWLGRGLRSDLWDRALELDGQCEAMPISLRPITEVGLCSYWAGDIDRSRALLERARRIGYERGDSTVAGPLFYICRLELLAGNWQSGLELADELSALATQDERPAGVLAALWAATHLHAHLGDEAETRRAAAEARRLSDQRGWAANTLKVSGAALSLLELSVDRPAAASEEARRAMSAERERGVEEPGLLYSFPEEIEAAIALGETDEAEELLDWIQPRAERLDREWALACIARCRGLLAAARGDEAGAAAAFERALQEHERVQYRRFDLARTLLAQGETLRRFKRRRAAREAIEAARELFDELGARLWSAKAERELARIAGRRRTGGLTETERRVAALVASGKSNKEVASELFVTVHTVESNLTRIYEKLGVRSRTELARRLPDLKL
jgi:DNA-binding CsgD family transcriptional regulator/tetratricopeptide (TPR) repeat protein